MKTILAIVTFVLLLIWIGGACLIFKNFDSWETRGQFGDMFGAVNALFSSLALIGVIVAILIQRKELTLQREELALTRKELSRSAKAQEQSLSLIHI